MPVDHRADKLELVVAKAVADECRDGIILCDSNGTMLHANEAATVLLSEAHLGDVKRISLSAIELGERQHAQVNGCVVTARPLLLENAGFIGIINIRPCGHLPSEQMIRTRFGLSSRESQVAMLLAERRTDAEIAAALGISWHTVRSHVERIFAALGCHTRRDAASKLTSSD